MKRLGQNAGFEHALKPYCLRREVGTRLTDNGVSDSQRNQIMSHAQALPVQQGTSRCSSKLPRPSIQGRPL